MICPKCKNEFKDGIKICPICNIPFDEADTASEPESDYVTVLQTDSEDFKEKVKAYLSTLNIDVQDCLASEARIPENTCMYVLSVPSAKRAIAVKEIHMLEQAEQQLAMEQALNDPETAKQFKEHIDALRLQPAEEFVKASTKYEEYRSSGILFVVFGFALSVFTILNLAGVLKLFPQVMSCCILLAFGIVFIVTGILTYLRSNTLKEAVEVEDKDNNEVDLFLESNVSKETLEALDDDDDLNPEILFLKQNEFVKQAIKANFPQLSESFIDVKAEEYLNKLFD